jgi:hypothetical protein
MACLLLLIDQWEELYTYRLKEGSAAEAHASRMHRFVDMLV